MADEKNGMYDVKANTLVVGRLSDPGRSGKNNEDYYGVFTHTGVTREGPQPVFVAVVADGIGGSASGEDASRLAVTTIRDYFGSTPVEPSRVFEQMRGVILKANSIIYEKAADNPSMRGMGTTIVLAVTIGDQLHLAHAGDSRAYLLRDNQMHLLTLDHTWAQEAIDANRITPEEALRHPNKNVIKRFLGPLESVEVDTDVIDPQHSSGDVRLPANRRMLPSQPMILQAGDTLLICSDGLNDELSDQQIERVLRSAPPERAVKELIDQANAAGGRDNITAVILQKPQAGAALLPVAPVATTLSASSDATVPMTAGAGGVPVVGQKKKRRSLLGNGLIGLAALLAVVALAWMLADRGGFSLPGFLSGGAGDGTPSDPSTPTVAVVTPQLTVESLAAAQTETPTPTPTPTVEPSTETPTSVGESAQSTEPTATETVVPTDAPSPTFTPSDTPTPIPSATPTAAAPTDRATPINLPTQTPSPQATGATDTPTPLVIGGGATNTPATTRTRAPTSTPFATPTVTPSPTRTETATRTATPIRTATPAGGATQAPTSTNTPGSSNAGGGYLTKPAGANAIPLEPDDGKLLNQAGIITFRWQTGYQPPTDYAYEFVVWPASAGDQGWRQGRSPVGAENEVCVDIDNAPRICRANFNLVGWQDNPNNGGFGPGLHYWGVTVVRIAPSYLPQFLLSSAGREFEYQRPASAPPFNGGDDRPGGG